MNADDMRDLPPTVTTEVVSDIVFGQVPTADGLLETLRLDVYLPANDSASLRPTILWFHGGGFLPGNDKRQKYITLFANALAARGYVGIAPDYRVRTEPRQDMAGTVRDAVADARMALGWVHAHSQDYRIDPQRLILAGGSAGAMIVLNLCHDPAQPMEKQRDGVRAIVGLWGPPGGGSRLFERVHVGSPPTLLIHGTADDTVPYQWSQQLAEELGHAGVPHALLPLPDAPHTPLQHKDQIIAAVAQFLSDYVDA